MVGTQALPPAKGKGGKGKGGKGTGGKGGKGTRQGGKAPAEGPGHKGAPGSKGAGGASGGAKGKVKKPTRKQKRIAKMRARPPTRYLITYDIDGPKVRLGIAWALAIAVAAAAGQQGVAALYGVVAGVAGWQSARAWKTWGEFPEEYTAGAIAAGLGVASAFGFGWVGVVAWVAVPLALFAGVSSDGARSGYFASVGFTLQCGLFVGVAAAAPGLALGLDLGGFVALLVLVCVYETGDFLVGSGSGNHFEGPLAGITGIVVFTFAMAVVHLSPFDGYDVIWFGLGAAVLCPLGQLAASAVLPRADAKAGALRRLDSLMLLGPVWVFALHQYLGARGR